MQAVNFDTFLSLMEKNWPEAHSALMKSFPLIDRISAIHDGVRAKVLAEHSLQGGDFGILTALRRMGEPYVLSPTLLRQYMLVSSGGLTKMLHRLESCEMISRVDSPDDGRIKLVKLTAKGKQTIEAVVAQVQKSNRRVLAHFDAEEIEKLDSLLSKLSHLLEDELRI
ncbi:MarR family winged helix-turn-helix transcriptional regulator [Vibrio sp. YYF0003]|uniref:MarR family winged helix-turn-helix transcriptional regulator n=1 Tax=Vibrio sp. YYF0003 TaxID=3116646 RepID=UPI002EA8B8E0|nr:MarR family transcriptional regulator [Vibrio sp. YYF0003]